MDLKTAVASSIADLLAPVREHFAKEEHKKPLEQLRKILKTVKLR